MTSFGDVEKTILRNKLLGRWAAEKLGLQGRDAQAHSDALAVGALDPDRSDVFSTIRKDFDTAQVAESDEQILRFMTEFTLQAGNQLPTRRGDSLDGAAVMLIRNLISR
jgi:hypothetical protein